MLLRYCLLMIGLDLMKFLACPLDDFLLQQGPKHSVLKSCYEACSDAGEVLKALNRAIMAITTVIPAM
nr:hypothetical protein Itr_chr05CG18330 [Ipomoea trifida]